jgi:sigma-B regulation protein RsbU (phosphoserine phosphatase)
MALTCSLVRVEATHIAAPAELVRRVNQHLLERNARGMFVTLVYGVLQQATRELVYVRAGHEMPLVWDRAGVLLPVTRGLGHPLGFLPEPALDLQTVILPPGSRLLLYTDGVTEATDDQGQFFGLERLLATAHSHLAGTAQDLCDHVVQTVMGYQPPAAQADDITLVAIHAD